MKKYVVLVQEIHYAHMAIEANSEEEAVNLVRDGEGEQIELEYSSTNDPDTWNVQEGK